MINETIPRPSFPLEYQTALKRLESFDPTTYENTRNHLSGNVSYLSPYITRGVLPLPKVMEVVLKKYSVNDAYKFIFELAWREYYQNCWRARGDDIFKNLRFKQKSVRTRKMIKAVAHAETQIHTLDQAIKTLYNTGYMHNHARMWVAGLCTNIANAHWWKPSIWMHYHLLDGDPASNMLSWQWVAGTSRKRCYLPQQGNINKYSPKQQTDTYLDMSYDTLSDREVPSPLEETEALNLTTFLPKSEISEFTDEPLYLYHPYSIDPRWHTEKPGTRVLVIDPEYFDRLPVSEKVMRFIINIAKTNISNIYTYVGSPAVFENKAIVYKSHPYTNNWPQSGESPEKLFPEVSGYHQSFSKFWNKAKSYLPKDEQ